MIGLLTILACGNEKETPVVQIPVLEKGGILETLNQISLLENPAVGVNAFFDTLTTPLFSDGEVWFFYKSDEKADIRLAGDFNGWNPGTPFQHFENIGVWYQKMTFEANARFDYKLVVNQNWILDPYNPNTIAGGFGANSELVMPDYVYPEEIRERTDILKGELEATRLFSTNTQKTYSLQIYLPANYQTTQQYPTVYFQDGNDYLQYAFAKTVLDNLIADTVIPPVIGVFVQPTDRNAEYAGNLRKAYRQFFVEELVPYIDSRYATLANSDNRVVLGDSFGGNISALISFQHPEVFGNCGLHSGAFWPNDEEAAHLILQTEKKDIRVASVWGKYEGDLTENMRLVSDFLMEEGYDFYQKELPEGHSWGLWRATLDDLLKHLLK